MSEERCNERVMARTTSWFLPWIGELVIGRRVSCRSETMISLRTNCKDINLCCYAGQFVIFVLFWGQVIVSKPNFRILSWAIKKLILMAIISKSSLLFMWFLYWEKLGSEGLEVYWSNLEYGVPITICNDYHRINCILHMGVSDDFFSISTLC